MTILVATGGWWYIDQSKSKSEMIQATQQAPTAEFVGLWRSDEECPFVQEIRADHTATMEYDCPDTPSTTVHSRWAVVDPAQEPELNSMLQNLKNITVIKMTSDTGGGTPSLFSVRMSNKDSLTMSILNGHESTYIFSRVR